MQVTVNVPEILPDEVVRRLIRQFEDNLKEVAQQRVSVKPRLSKWAKIAQDVHTQSPLYGLSDYVLRCSQEIREHEESQNTSYYRTN